MNHLLNSLHRGEDIGHYGRLVFVLVARHFLDEDQIVKYLRKDPDCDEAKARGLVEQVSERDYNPPTRARVLAWMEQQGFPICPDAGDPSACNVYRDLKFPDEVYQRISGFYEAKAEAQ
jgi:DNA primase large subunit